MFIVDDFWICFQAEILSKYKPTINSTQLIKNLRQVNQTTTKALEYFKSIRHIVLYYEDVVKNHTVCYTNYCIIFASPSFLSWVIIWKDVPLNRLRFLAVMSTYNKDKEVVKVKFDNDVCTLKNLFEHYFQVDWFSLLVFGQSMFCSFAFFFLGPMQFC